MSVEIRNEERSDSKAIQRLTIAAFRDEPHSSHTEHFIINELRRRGKLTVSLVALEKGRVVGHVAVSPVAISSGASGWYALGPVCVKPERQNRGIGTKLVQAALARLQQIRAFGCVLLGNPAYYKRFGFTVASGLELQGVPHEYFQVMSLRGTLPAGTVYYDCAFEATD